MLSTRFNRLMLSTIGFIGLYCLFTCKGNQYNQEYMQYMGVNGFIHQCTIQYYVCQAKEKARKVKNELLET